MTGPFKRGSYVRPDGTAIETFEAFKRRPDGSVIEDRSDMQIMFKPMNPTTWMEIGPAEVMTEEIWATLIDTRDHPDYFGGHEETWR